MLNKNKIKKYVSRMKINLSMIIIVSSISLNYRSNKNDWINL